MPALIRTTLLHMAGSWALPRTVRWAIYRSTGLKLQTRAISAGCTFTGPAVVIGRGSYVNTGCFFDSSALITIGERCDFGPRVTFVTSTHEMGGPEHRAGALKRLPITIGSGTWVGAGVTILPGVTIGEGCVVAAGALVNRDLDAHGTYAGTPARRVR
jgi:acetyltransferase-like isoleucine patch superfamily enzyme